MEEIFKDVVGYEGLYQVSNIGNVKSLGNDKTRKEKILKPSIGTCEYLIVRLSKNGKPKTNTIHQLIAMAFLNHIPNSRKLVVDHINDNKLDNRVENLQIVTQRFNTFKTQGEYSSKHKGVSWHKASKKWISHININGIKYHVGYFKKEFDAHVAYQNKLLSLNN